MKKVRFNILEIIQYQNQIITLQSCSLAIEMKKTQILINKPAHLGLSILDLIITVMYEFWYDSVRPIIYGENAKLCYVDTGSFIVHVKTDDIYKNIAEDVENQI